MAVIPFNPKPDAPQLPKEIEVSDIFLPSLEDIKKMFLAAQSDLNQLMPQEWMNLYVGFVFPFTAVDKEVSGFINVSKITVPENETIPVLCVGNQRLYTVGQDFLKDMDRSESFIDDLPMFTRKEFTSKIKSFNPATDKISGLWLFEVAANYVFGHWYLNSKGELEC